MANDDKEIKGATSKLIKRVIMAIAIFFVVWPHNTLSRKTSFKLSSK